MKYLFLSPHLDDAVLSCGEYINSLVSCENDVKVITIFSGVPVFNCESKLAKEFHAKWGLKEDVVIQRRNEDKNAMKILGVNFDYLDELDSIYRVDIEGNFKFLTETQIFLGNLSKDKDTLERVQEKLEKNILEYKPDYIFSPLGIGRHVDHVMVRTAVENISESVKADFFYYEDIPYVCQGVDSTWEEELTKNLIKEIIEVEKKDFDYKLDATKCYESQLDMLWGNTENMDKQLGLISMKYMPQKRSLRFWEKQKNKEN